MANRRTPQRRRRGRRHQGLLLPQLSGRAVREILALVCLLAAIVSAVSIFAPDSGFVIRPWHAALSYLFGWGIVAAPLILAGLAVVLWLRTPPAARTRSAAGMLVLGLSLLGILHLAGGGGLASVSHGEGGGWLGYAISDSASAALGSVGAWGVLTVLALVGLGLAFNVSVADLAASFSPSATPTAETRRAVGPGGGDGRSVGTAVAAESSEAASAGRRASRPRPGLIARLLGADGNRDQDQPEPLILRRQRADAARTGRAAVAVGSGGGSPTASGSAAGTAGVGVLARAAGAAAASGRRPDGTDGDRTPDDESAGVLPDGGERRLALEVGEWSASGPLDVDEVRTWELPPLELLAEAAPSNVAQLDLAAKGQLIRETLANFRIGVKVARIQEGPVVTQYALEVDPGVKLSRIEALADNLALALSARSMRIEAPIPGQPYVGIEIPNTAFDLVTLKEVLGSQTFEEAAARSKLAFALGQDVAGQPHAADLTRMPHVLIAGATGSGKSVCVNALICSLLVRATPAEVNLILIDPKRVELAQYRGIPHLLCEVIVEPEKAVNALKWTVATMEARYHEFAQRGVRNIAGYNASLLPGEKPMAYIVVVIDELADLMMVSAYEVEATVTRVAQLARATGIHLVVATQRPSVQVVTGLIKANIPSRIAFAMTSGVDSRTILDTTGAEDLLGRGDMLYQPIDAPRAVRLQGVLVTDPEIDALARHWREQGGPQYRPEITAARGGDRGSGADRDDGDDGDPLLRQAIDIVRRSDKASASLLQRRLRIGYARAARILDQMEDRGVVGSADGSKFREVLVTADGWGGEVAPGGDPER